MKGKLFKYQSKEMGTALGAEISAKLFTLNREGNNILNMNLRAYPRIVQIQVAQLSHFIHSLTNIMRPVMMTIFLSDRSKRTLQSPVLKHSLHMFFSYR
jgi:hypothetical protein